MMLCGFGETAKNVRTFFCVCNLMRRRMCGFVTGNGTVERDHVKCCIKMITCYFELGSDILVEPQIGRRLRA